jgi:hypothetical protein
MRGDGNLYIAGAREVSVGTRRLISIAFRTAPDALPPSIVGNIRIRSNLNPRSSPPANRTSMPEGEIKHRRE